MNEWIYLDDSTLEGTFTCDTRDFHVKCSPVVVEVPFKENIINKKEIYSILKELETKSGGKREWRQFYLSNYPFWIKYITFTPINNSEYIAYTTKRNVKYPLNLKEKVRTEYE